jgi:uncharacterized membrane protein
MDPRTLSHQLRFETDPYLRNRRIVAGLALGAASMMGLIALYQLGMIRHLLDLPGKRFDADKVDASDEAYEHLEAPDAALGFASYAITLLLAAAGSRQRWRTRPWLPIALALKASLDATQAARLTRVQWVRHRSFCIWCLLAAAATFVAVPLTLAEAARAAQRILHRSRSAVFGES